jgi:hypothetical protein
MWMFNAREDEKGVWVCDEGGLPISLAEALRLHRQLAEYIESRSESDILAKTKATVARDYPSMYSQMFNEVLPKEFRKDPVKLTPKQRKASGYVYLMHGIGTVWYKIGHSVDPLTRAGAIGAKAPFEIDLMLSYWAEDRFHDERIWHAHFASKRASGEWFELTQSDIELFKEAC